MTPRKPQPQPTPYTRIGETWSTFDHEPARKEKTYFDEARGVHVVKLYSGDCYVTRRPNEVLMTVLGSCVAACIRDPLMGVGGMNHFLLPDAAGDGIGGARYGAFAMEELINGILKLGGRKDHLEVKVFGGGNVIDSSAKIGDRNVEFVRRFLREEGLAIAGSDLGGDHPRRINYYPETGKVMLRRLLRRDDEETVRKDERRFSQNLLKKPVEGSIELFS